MTRRIATRRWPVSFVLAVGLLLGGVAFSAAPVSAATTLHVTNCTDTGVSADGSLRGEIAAAAAGDTIVFNQNCTGATAITLSQAKGPLSLTQDVTIDGTGHTVVLDGGCTANCGTINAVGGVEVLNVNGGVTATLNALTIQNGVATNANGGGIFNDGTLTVTNSTISGNTAVYYGGGIDNGLGGTLMVTNSTISGNRSANYNGGGGGGMTNGGSATLTNTIVAGNTAAYSTPNFDGPVASGGHNLFGSTDGNTITLGPGDIVNADPLLGTLGNHGGPTQTLPLLFGSPAIDAGDDLTCAQSGAGHVNGVDQRGVIRPEGAHCDIGAFEAHFTLTVTSGSPQTTVATQPFANPLVVTFGGPDAPATLSGVPVTFSAPGRGASATFTGNPATTDASGRASVTAAANGTAGTYTVTASTPGAAKVTFTLKNVLVVPVVNTNGDGAANANNCVAGNANTCRLRGAIAAENAGGATGATITFAANETITLNQTAGTLTLAPTSGTERIDGSGHTIVVDGNNAVTVFTVNSGTVTLNALTIRHGNTGNGGGIDNESGGTLTVTNSTISGNDGGGAGGIYNNGGGTLTVTNSLFTGNSGGGIENANQGTLTVTNSTFSGNSAAFGGGIDNYDGVATVTNSTFSGNTAGMGGGIVNYGSATVANSTFSGNTANGYDGGGGIYNNGGTATVANSTLSGNSALNATGGGIINSGGIFSGTVTLTNTIVAKNTATSGGPDASGAVTDGGGNLIGDGTGMTGLTNGTNGDQVGTAANPINPLLAPLGNYGGPTQTIPLLPGSPAIDAGKDATCAAALPTGAGGKDQRGVTRPVGAHCDIGAFEARFTLTVSGGTPQLANLSRPFARPLAVTLGGADAPADRSGAPVTFTAHPVGGASATLGTPNPATTQASGGASVAATANGSVGTIR
ncbi:MAG: choice-of-anchor Q domain-containing protein [Thermomicrobiales bacterium]